MVQGVATGSMPSGIILTAISTQRVAALTVSHISKTAKKVKVKGVYV